MLYVYIINIFIYSGTRSVLGSVPVRFGYFGYKNIGTVRVFQGIGPVPVSDISVWFRFGSSVPVILPRPRPFLTLKPQCTVFKRYIFFLKKKNLKTHQSRTATCQWSPRTVQETNQNRSLFHHFYHLFLQKKKKGPTT